MTRCLPMKVDGARLPVSEAKSMRSTLRNTCACNLLVLALSLALLAKCGADNLKIGDFRGTNYGDWQSTGTAFNSGPAAGDLLAQLEIENALVTRWPAAKWKAIGPRERSPRRSSRSRGGISAFRIGGGDYERHTCLNLLIDGRVVRSATGWRSDRLAPVSWDVSQFLGQSARCRSWTRRAAIGDTSTSSASSRPTSRSACRW